MSFHKAVIIKANADSVMYHTEPESRGSAKYTMSSHSLREFDRCPSRWKAGYESPDSDSKRFGSLMDCRLLTPELFEDRFVVIPETYPAPKDHAKVKKGEIKQGDPLPWHASAKYCSDWIEKFEAVGAELVKKREVEDADAAIARFLADEDIKAFLDASDRQVWVQAQWVDEETGVVVPVKGLLDLVPRNDTEFYKCLGDLKTTRNAGVMAWQSWCNKAEYHIQAALYTDLYVAATSEDRTDFCFLIQENYAPWEPGKRILTQDFLEDGRREIARMLGNYCRCIKSGKWPGYDDNDEARDMQGWSPVAALPRWDKGEFAPKFLFEGLEGLDSEAPAMETDDVTP